MSETKTFEELANDEVGTVYTDRFDDGVRVIIMRGPASLCAYLGVPENHPLAGSSYNDLRVTCNGGLTYGQLGGNERSLLPAGFYWYGWDYAHSGDFCFYDLKYGTRRSVSDKKWLVKDVEGEIWSAVYDTKKAMKLAEDAFAKGAKWRAAAQP